MDLPNHLRRLGEPLSIIETILAILGPHATVSDQLGMVQPLTDKDAECYESNELDTRAILTEELGLSSSQIDELKGRDVIYESE